MIIFFFIVIYLYIHDVFNGKQIIFIRNSQGRNDNPNAIQFASAFKKLLVCHPLITSVGSNVVTNATGILTASSGNQKRLPQIESNQTEVLELGIVYEELMVEEIEAMDPYDQHLCAYVALCIEAKLLQNVKQNKYKCMECVSVLLDENEKINDEFLAKKQSTFGQIKQPTKCTVKIVIFCNAVMKRFITSQHSQGNNFNAVCSTIFCALDINDLYGFAEFEQHTCKLKMLNNNSHKEYFILNMIKTYMSLKSQLIGKKITDEEQGELIRNRKKHDIHQAGQ